MNARTFSQSAIAKSDDVTARKSGRAAFTEDGRSIWEWQTATGVFTRTITDEQLARLEATNLRIEETPAVDSMITTGYPAQGTVLKVSARKVAYRARKSSSFETLQGLLRRLIGVN